MQLLNTEYMCKTFYFKGHEKEEACLRRVMIKSQEEIRED